MTQVPTLVTLWLLALAPQAFLLHPPAFVLALSVPAPPDRRARPARRGG